MVWQPPGGRLLGAGGKRTGQIHPQIKGATLAGMVMSKEEGEAGEATGEMHKAIFGKIGNTQWGRTTTQWRRFKATVGKDDLRKQPRRARQQEKDCTQNGKTR